MVFYFVAAFREFFVTFFIPFAFLALIFSGLLCLPIDTSPKSPLMLVIIFLFLILAIPAFRGLLDRVASDRVKKSFDNEVDNLELERLGPEPTNSPTRKAVRKINFKIGRGQVVSQSEYRVAIEAMVGAITSNAATLRAQTTLPDFRNALGRLTGTLGATSDERFKRLTDALDRVQGRVDDEYSDVISRTGWLLTSQAFLLTALFTAVSSDRLDPTARYWASLCIALSGALIAHSVARAIFFGHALIERLKQSRDAVETATTLEFGLPRLGLRASGNRDAKETHAIGHAATRYLPSLAFVAWSLLASAAFFDLLAKPSETVLLPPTAIVTSFGSGWHALKPSPSFALAANDFGTGPLSCPAPDPSKVKDWIAYAAVEWKSRSNPSKDDQMIIVGGTDVAPLKDKLKEKFDSNTVLAAQRAETVVKLLKAETDGDKNELYKIDRDNVIVLVTGPRFVPEKPGKADCDSTELAKDRVVRIWMPSKAAR